MKVSRGRASQPENPDLVSRQEIEEQAMLWPVCSLIAQSPGLQRPKWSKQKARKKSNP